MLPSKNRLEIKTKNKKNLRQKISDTDFNFLYEKNKEGILKAAIIISKRTAPLAVDRNRIKRLISKSLEDKLETGIDLIVFVKANVVNLKSNEVAQKINKLFLKIK